MTKQDKISKYLAEPLKIGDTIIVQGLGNQDKKSWFGSSVVKDIIDGVPYIEEHRRLRVVTEQWKKSTYRIGADPYPKVRNRVQNINYAVESILHSLFKEDKYDLDGIPIMTANFNPFVFVDGVKKYYQRPLVWDTKQKQLLIESLYNEVDCGKVLVRERSWEELGELAAGGHELAFIDIVDGKQRLSALQEFINNDYPDLHGNYYNDLSDRAQGALTSSQLISYSVLPENTPDKDVLVQFLRLNFAGVPQSQEHLDYIKSLI
jgi:Protein of unknown function DUF262